MQEDKFYTLKGYTKKNKEELSPAMEDYLEMIYRDACADEVVRVNALAARLHVKPPSSSKMVSRLKEQGLVDFEHYGLIRLTEKGQEMGAYLLRRHEILHRFFCFVNRSKDQLELVEKIEHFMNKETIDNLETLLPRLQMLE